MAMDFLKKAGITPKPIYAAPPAPKPITLPALPKSKPAKELSDYADLIDEVGAMQTHVGEVNLQIVELQKTLAPYGAKLKELTEKLEEHVFPDHDPAQPATIYGHKFRIDAGPQARMRAISDMDKVKTHLGTKVFMDIAKVQLGDLDKYLTEAQRDECTVVTLGRRKLKIIAGA